MTPAPIAIRAVPIDGGSVIAVAGEIDLLTADRLSEALAEALARDTLVVVDLSAVEFLSSSGLSTLALAHRSAPAGHELRLVAADRVTLRPLQITGMVEEIAVFTSVADALAGVGAVVCASEPG